MTTKRRTYTDEFKREAVRLWETTDKTAAAIEAELGITPGLLNKWKQRLKANGDVTFPGRGRLTADEEKIRQLERELAIARQERDILKKAVAITSASLSTGFSNPKS
jgi:transposase